MKKFVFVLLIVCVCMFLTGCTQSSSDQVIQENNNSIDSEKSVSVSIENFKFILQDLTVKQGTTVTWTNKDSAPHNVVGGELQSPVLSKGQTFSYTFNNKGRIDYICTLHPSMKGSITVE